MTHIVIAAAGANPRVSMRGATQVPTTTPAAAAAFSIVRRSIARPVPMVSFSSLISVTPPLPENRLSVGFGFGTLSRRGHVRPPAPTEDHEAVAQGEGSQAGADQRQRVGAGPGKDAADEAGAVRRGRDGPTV